MAGPLENRVAIVTGAASGQGRAVALRFAQAGARLALCDRDVEGLQETGRLAIGEGAQPVCLEVDLADLAQIDRFVDDVADRCGGIDIVYNNAGISISQSIENHDEALWDLIHTVNVKSYFFLIKRALPQLRRSSTPAIVNVSSMAGVFGQASMAAYCSSKGAVNLLTKALAVELAPDNIRVNAIAPGLIETPMVLESVKDFEPAEQQRMITGWAQRQLMKRAAAPKEVADVALFLVSDESSFITGEVMNVSGGWAAF